MKTESQAVCEIRATHVALNCAIDNLRRVEAKKTKSLKALARGPRRSSRIYVLSPLLTEKVLAISTNSKVVMMKGIRLVEKGGKTYLLHIYAGVSGKHLDTLILMPPDILNVLRSEVEKAKEALSKKI